MLEVFSNLSDSMILFQVCSLCVVQEVGQIKEKKKKTLLIFFVVLQKKIVMFKSHWHF